MKPNILFLAAVICMMSISVLQAQIWEQTNGPCGAEMFSLALSPNGDLYAGVQFNGLYRSTDDGNTWFHVGFRSKTITQVFTSVTGNIFVTAVDNEEFNYDPYRSTDNGETWNLLNTNISFDEIGCWDGDNSGNLYLAGFRFGMGSDIMKSTDEGETWTNWSWHFSVPNDLLFYDSYIFMSDMANGIFKRINNSWVKCFPNGIETNCIVRTSGGILLAGTNAPYYGVYRSIDSADTWQRIFSAGIENTRVLSIIIDSGGNIFAGSSNGVYKSTDEGLTWIQYGLQNTEVWTMSFTNSNIPLAGNEFGVYRWNTNLQSWEDSDDGIFAHKTMALAINKNDNFQFASTTSGLFRTSDYGENWEYIWPQNWAYPGIFGMDEIPLLFDDESGMLFIYETIEDKIYRSSDNGNTWSTFLAPSGSDFFCLTNGFSPGEIFGGGRIWPNSTFFYSSNYGENWFYTFLNASDIQCLAVNGITNNIFAGTAGSGVFRSTDNGINWRSFNIGLISTNVLTMETNTSGDIFIGTDKGVFRSRDQGGNWTWVGLENDTVSALAINSAGHVLAGTKGGLVFKTTNEGETWFDFGTGLGSAPVSCIEIDQNDFALLGTIYEGVFRTTESTVPVELTSFTAEVSCTEVLLHWTTATELNNLGFEIQRSIEEEEFFTIEFINGHGTTTGQHNYNYIDRDLENGTYFYRLKQVDYDGSFNYSEIIEVVFKAIDAYLLEQNYPNPFNPNTVISYQLPVSSDVTLKVYDILGNEIAILVDEYKPAGKYEVEFNTSSHSGNVRNLTSGVYFYQLKAGEFVQTRKMILLK